jgi:hypothetical protein
MERNLRVQPLQVLTDGGSREGILVFAGEKLAAVLVHLKAAETGDDRVADGWYLEAGFGPCGPLITLQPEIFPHQEDALKWIGKSLRLGHKPQSS